MLEQFVSFVVGDAALAYGPTILFYVFLGKIVFRYLRDALSTSIWRRCI